MASLISLSAFGQQDLSQQLREIEYQQSMLRQKQAEIQIRNSELDLDRAIRRLEIMNEKDRVNDRNNRIDYLSMLKVAEQEAAAKKLQQVQQSLQIELEQNEVRNKNNVFIGFVLIFLASIIMFVMKKVNKEKIMHENQKIGVIIIIVAMLSMILAVAISDNWVPQYDALTNLMSSLRIQFFENEYIKNTNTTYFIDVPTKYIVLSLVCVAAYGLTIYLGITSFPKLKKQVVEINSAAANE